MEKQELVNQLNTIKLNFEICISALAILNHHNVAEILKDPVCKFGTHKWNPNAVIRVFSNEKTAKDSTHKFLKMSFGTTIKESFEMIKEYCIKTGQEEIWKNQPFYHYARIIRNVMSHNFLFDFSKENKNKFPVKWKSKKIELSMQGLLLFDFFGPIDVFDLLSTFNYFVKNTLN